MSGFDVDFIVTIGGKDVTEYVYSWTLSEVDQGVSSLQVVLENHDGNNTYNIKDKVEIRFGYVGDLSDKVIMDVRKIEEIFDVNSVRQFIVDAYDCTWGLDGKGFQGNAGNNTKEAIDKVLQTNNLKGDTKNLQETKPGIKGGKGEEKKTSFILPSQSAFDTIMYLLNRSKAIG